MFHNHHPPAQRSMYPPWCHLSYSPYGTLQFSTASLIQVYMQVSLALDWQVESLVLLPPIASCSPSSSPIMRPSTSCLGGSSPSLTLLHLTMHNQSLRSKGSLPQQWQHMSICIWCPPGTLAMPQLGTSAMPQLPLLAILRSHFGYAT
jgi:hypothetical protein